VKGGRFDPKLQLTDTRTEQTLARVLEKRVAAFGDKPWLVTEERTFSYQEADTLSNRLAHGLRRLGIDAGRTVLIMLPDSPVMLLSWVALAKLGAIEVPVNTHLRGRVLAHVINDSRASELIVDERYFEQIETVAAELPGLERLIVHRSETGKAGSRLPDTHAGRFELVEFDDVFGTETAPPPAPSQPHDLIAVMYTSGTTGPSKGVMVTHTHAYEYALSVVELLEMSGDDVYYNPLPLFHIAGQWGALYSSCIAGATVVVPPAFSLHAFWSDVRRHNATCSFLLGAMANWLYRQEPAERDADNPMQRMLIVPLLPEVEDFKHRFDCLVSTTWGSTEINVPTRSTFTLANNKTCGRVAADRYEVRIVDENDHEVPAGVAGEAVVRTKEPWLLMAGYWQNPEGTAQAWHNQWVHSGDLLMADAEGNLYFVDRKKDAIRRRGENISSMEVEIEINAHPSVLECAVIPADSEHGEQEVMAVLVLKEQATLAPEALIHFLGERMAYFMVPRYVETVAALPKTQTGKIQKYTLRQRGVSEATWDREAAGVSVKR
jgi:crotonobetaine/carnitine-CoA ligase